MPAPADPPELVAAVLQQFGGRIVEVTPAPSAPEAKPMPAPPEQPAPLPPVVAAAPAEHRYPNGDRIAPFAHIGWYRVTLRRAVPADGVEEVLLPWTQSQQEALTCACDAAARHMVFGTVCDIRVWFGLEHCCGGGDGANPGQVYRRLLLGV